MLMVPHVHNENQPSTFKECFAVVDSSMTRLMPWEEPVKPTIANAILKDYAERLEMSKRTDGEGMLTI